jgi:hypothetical protein
MRLVEAWEWTKEDSVGLAIFAAELAIHIYEKRKPGDDRPRKAIEAAKKWLADPSEENRKGAQIAASSSAAAYAASAAYASDAASSAAASSAAAYASSAASKKEIKTKCEAWIQARLASKQSIKADK